MDEKILDFIHKSGINLRLNEPLSNHTTLKIGGPAKYFVILNNGHQLISLLKLIKGQRILIIGAGSNLLISDEGFDGIVIKLKGEFTNIKFIGPERIYASAGTMLPMLIKTAVDNSLSGLEELYGIPGTVGGAIIMNAGTKFATISDKLEYVDLIDIKNPDSGVVKVKKNELKFGYRESNLDNVVIVGCEFLLSPGDKTKLQNRISEILLIRSKTQPLDTYNIGCIFKNPEDNKFTAGMLIEKCGLKGYTVGGAQVSEKHCNFIINRNNATAKDFVKIIQHIITTVKKEFNVTLTLEIKLVNINLDLI